MRVSVVISTYNRSENLKQLLIALPNQRYREFEVIVVNGPSTDDTDNLLNNWRKTIKFANCAIPNLSISRNIGISRAAGDIVAFIDDDAIPHPRWLESIVAKYERSEIGAVGGFVFDRTGYHFQTTNIVCDRFGGADNHYPTTPGEEFNTPLAPKYSALLGTNCSARRALLYQLGGFDEEIEYFLDETDLCVRLIDAGHKIGIAPKAIVFHNFADSHIREAGLITQRYSILKNKAYFAAKHGTPIHGFDAVADAVEGFVEDHRRDINYWIGRGRLPAGILVEFEKVAYQAVNDGVERALAGNFSRLNPDNYGGAPEFKRFLECKVMHERRTICMLTSAVAVDASSSSLAEAFASLGHTVHLVMPSQATSTVKLVNGVWVHQIADADSPNPTFPIDGFPVELWHSGKRLVDEVNRISESDGVDVVIAEMGAGLEVAAHQPREWPLIGVFGRIYPNCLLENPLHDHCLREAIAWQRRAVLLMQGALATSVEVLESVERCLKVVLPQSITFMLPVAGKSPCSIEINTWLRTFSKSSDPQIMGMPAALRATMGDPTGVVAPRGIYVR
jgi:glycogen synthase